MVGKFLIEDFNKIINLVSSKMTSASGQLVQRIRLYDEEEHPTQNNIMIDEDLVQYYQLLADRGDAQAQVKDKKYKNILRLFVFLVWSRSIILFT